MSDSTANFSTETYASGHRGELLQRFIGRLTGYLRYFWTLEGTMKKIEIGRRIIPSVQRQYKREAMAGPIGYWERLRKYHIGALKSLGLQPFHSFLDIGCGPLQGGIAFIEYLDAGKYAGIDLNEKSLAEGYKQIVDAGLVSKNPFLAVSDTFGKNELKNRKFDYIWCSQMLYHLDEDLIKILFRRILQLLARGGKFYGDIIGFPNNVTEKSYWNGFLFYLHTVSGLRDVADRYGLRLRRVGQIASFGYPKEIALHTNELLEISKKRGR
jgi:SAM-dependent methyltransferase